MTHKALVRRLQISCLGLDPIDPLRLLVDDVIAALAQQEPVKYSDYESDGVHHNKPPQRTWVGLTPDELNMIGDSMRTWNSWTITDVYFAIEAKLKEKNNAA